MYEEQRTVRFDRALGIEAFRLQGVVQRFPNHFHDHYVIGYVECGQRELTCGGQDYTVGAGDMTLFHPGETHSCRQLGKAPLDYRGINVPPARMCDAVREFCPEGLPRFSGTVFCRSELAPAIRALHALIMEEGDALGKEEGFLLLLRGLFETYRIAPAEAASNAVLDEACAYLDAHYAEPISLDMLSAQVCLSKYHLLRAFTRYKSITPYQYLTAVRISAAKRLLESGTSPAEAALGTGFSDQSHFTGVFKAQTGLTPRQYQAIF